LAALGLLGYQPARRYDKIRTIWRYHAHELALDHTPMGDFVEIEGPSPREVAVMTGLPLAAADLRSYLEIYDEFGERQSGIATDMLFPRAPEGFTQPSSDPAEETEYEQCKEGAFLG